MLCVYGYDSCVSCPYADGSGDCEHGQPMYIYHGQYVHDDGMDALNIIQNPQSIDIATFFNSGN